MEIITFLALAALFILLVAVLDWLATSTELERQVAEDLIDIKSEILFSYEDIALLVYEKFQSGNDVPVDQITIKRSEIEPQLETLDFYKEVF